MSESNFFQVIAPLFGVTKTVVLGISTPSEAGERNYYSRLMSTRMENPLTGKMEPVFKAVRIGMSCTACTAAGRSQQCTHKTKYTAPWKPVSRMKLLEAVYGPERKEEFNREVRGELDTKDKPAFSRVGIEDMSKRTSFTFASRPRCIFVCMDPAGGGEASKFAIVSIAYDGPHAVILHISECDVGLWAPVRETIFSHISALRRHDEYKQALMCFVIEANYDPVWGDVVREAVEMQFGPMGQEMYFVRKDPTTNKNKPRRVGVWTNASNKALYVDKLNELLCSNAVHYAYNNGYDTARRDTADDWKEMRGKLEFELSNFEVRHLPNGKVVYSGKPIDDKAMALQMAVYWSKQLMMHDRRVAGLCGYTPYRDLEAAAENQLANERK